MDVRGPTERESNAMMKAFTDALESPIFVDSSGRQHPLNCSICDTMAHADIEMEWIHVDDLAEHCKSAKMRKDTLRDIYPEALIQQYTAPNVASLESFVLSPRTVHNTVNNHIAICEPCGSHIRAQGDRKKNRRTPSDEAIISGYLIGDAPSILTDLNEVELALVSGVRTNCQSWIYFAGCHQHIKGWHTFYENRPASNVATVANLADAGLKGQLLVVLCGPFTRTQEALTRAQTLVNPDKVIAAFTWLKINNYHYHDMVIPRADELPIPEIIEEDM